MNELIQTMHSTASGLAHASRMIDAGETPQASAILNCASHCRQAAATITQLQAELAEAREVPGRIVDWLNATASDANINGGRTRAVTLRSIATAIEARDWSKP